MLRARAPKTGTCQTCHATGIVSISSTAASRDPQSERRRENTDMARNNVHNANDIGAGVTTWYFSQPPIGRTFITLILATTVLSFTLGVIDLKHIALIWPRVWGKFEVRHACLSACARVTELHASTFLPDPSDLSTVGMAACMHVNSPESKVIQSVPPSSQRMAAVRTLSGTDMSYVL